MNVFELDDWIIGDYERFARSFTQIRAGDIRDQVDALYSTGRFWPEPLISINPHYERDADVESLRRDLERHARWMREADALYRHAAPRLAASRITACCAEEPMNTVAHPSTITPP